MDMDFGHKGRSPISWKLRGKRVEKGVEIGSEERECVKLKGEEGDRLRVDSS